MIKLDEARSLLYRRQILQENIRWKALYGDLQDLHVFCTAQTSTFQPNFIKLFRIFQHFSQNFAQILMICFFEFKISPNILENIYVEIF